MLPQLARALRSAWRGVRTVAGALGRLFLDRPSGDVLAVAIKRGTGRQLEGELRRLAASWLDTFCGACAAGPDYPQGRCPKCLQKLARILDPQGEITPPDPVR